MKAFLGSVQGSLLRGIVNSSVVAQSVLKFVYSEKATKFWVIFTLLLSTAHTEKSKVEILENFVAFSEYMNFTSSLEGSRQQFQHQFFFISTQKSKRGYLKSSPWKKL